MWKISIYLSDLAKKSVTFLSDWDLSAALSWAWWLGWWMLPPGHGETWDSQTENHEILPNYSEFDLFMFVFSISNNLCLAQQLLNTTLVSSLPCFLFISARRRPLVAELGWVQVRFSDTNNCLRLPGPQASNRALSPPGVMSLCVFVFIRAGHCKETPGLSDSQPSVSVTVSLCIRISSSEWGHWAENTDH